MFIALGGTIRVGRETLCSTDRDDRITSWGLGTDDCDQLSQVSALKRYGEDRISLPWAVQLQITWKDETIVWATRTRQKKILSHETYRWWTPPQTVFTCSRVLPTIMRSQNEPNMHVEQVSLEICSKSQMFIKLNIFIFQTKLRKTWDHSFRECTAKLEFNLLATGLETNKHKS